MTYNNTPTVKAVCISEIKGTVKNPVSEITLKENYGIVGDAHAGNGQKQVSLLADESVDKFRSKIPNLKTGAFAENILTSGISLHKLPVGARLQIGEAILEITQIGKICHNDECAIKRQTGECVMPSEGIFTSVIRGGLIKQGDSIEVNYVKTG